jgi:DNA invertase Pin-like site-specific DNA recombinase
MNVYGYVRVSASGQCYEMQVDQIKAYCAYRDLNLVKIFADTASGKDMLRLEFQAMLETLELNPQGVEAIVVTRLDRVGRSLRDLLRFVDWCAQKKLNFVALASNIDTTTKEGRLFLYLMSSLAEYERELILERTNAGLKRFVQIGGKLGRTPKRVDMVLARNLIAQGVPKAEVARRLKIARQTLYRNLNTPPELPDH